MATPAEGLISPPPSASSPSPSHGIGHDSSRTLPDPRGHPLPPGSAKEIALINYLDSKILRISRRYGKKFTDSDSNHGNDTSPGYTNLGQVVDDVSALVDVSWASGTPHLQTSHLLSLAGTLLSYMPAFTFSTCIFPLLSKLDSAFVALLRQSPERNSNKPRQVLSVTDKVRIKSLVEETRVAAVNCASSAGYSASVQDLSSDDDSDSGDEEATLDSMGQDSTAINMALSKIYRGTLEILGDTLT